MREPIAVYYIRYSSMQQEDGDSERRQLHLIEMYAKANNLRIDESLSAKDRSVSAYHGANMKSGMGDILNHIKEGRLQDGDYLLLENLDRFSRDHILQSAPTLFQIISNGINVVTVSDGQLFSKDGTALMTMMQSIMQLSRAHDESKAKSDRGKAVWDAKREAIKVGNSNKIMTSVSPNWLKPNKDKTEFVIHEERANIVKRIFDLSDQGIGSVSITKILNGENIPTFGRAEFWQKSAIDKILNSRAVLGECEFYTGQVLENGKKRRVSTGIVVKDYYPKVISEALFDRVQMKRKSRVTGGGGRKGSLFSNLFTGIVKCGECNSTMQFINKGKRPKGRTYLKCRGHEHGTRCKGVNWRYDKVESHIINLMQHLPIQDLLPQEAQETQLMQQEKEVQAMENSVMEINSKISKLLDILDDCDNSAIKSITERVSTYQNKLDAEQHKLSALKSNYLLEREKIEHAEDKIRTLRGLLDFKASSEESLCVTRATINARLKGVISQIRFCSTKGEHNRWGGKVFYIHMKNEETYICRIDPPSYLKVGLDSEIAAENMTKLITGHLEIEPLKVPDASPELQEAYLNKFENTVSK
ncbi:recombinase family protein [Neptuniibacter caesariensis]|nr:recombinase family protein [Neptuniibacter caesariensis]